MLRQVGPDFETQYGYRPWRVESFVDREQILDACYQASHWSAIGQTQGRGRQARANKVAQSVKTLRVPELVDCTCIQPLRSVPRVCLWGC